MPSIPSGPVFSVVTPFTVEGKVDFDNLESYLGMLHEAGARVFYAMAYNSRYPQMTPEEILGFNHFVATITKSFSSDVYVIVGDPVACSTETSINFACKAADSGADLFSSIFNERYYSDEQILSHFRCIGLESPIPTLVHQMPLLSGYGGHLIQWPRTCLEAVLELDFVAAMKEDSKDPETTSFVLHRFASEKAIILSGGGKRQLIRHRPDGAQHWLNGVGVFAPQICVGFAAALKANDMSVVDRVISEVEMPFFDGPVKDFGWHLAMKSAIEHQGLFPRYERLPLMALDDKDHKQVGRVLESMPLDDPKLWPSDAT